MYRRAHFAFTGVVVVAPAYPAQGSPMPGPPIYVLMPNSPRAREFSAFDVENKDRTVTVSAHTVFAVFPYAHLDTSYKNRRADYKYPNELMPDQGVCFFFREELRVEPDPENDAIEYIVGDTSGAPDPDSTAVGWIADWKRFAPNPDRSPGSRPSAAAFFPDALWGEGDFVRMVLPGGLIWSRFACNPAPKAYFPYGEQENPPETFFFAHEIVVTLAFEDNATAFKLVSKPFDAAKDVPRELVFEWGDATDIWITFGNGAMASLDSVLAGSCAGHDHEGRADHEFQLLYKDVIDCPEDSKHRKPVPVITSKEILRIPCLASMIEVNDGNEQPESATVVSSRNVSLGRFAESAPAESESE